MTNIKIEISKLLKEKYGIDPDISMKMFDDGLLSFKACRDILVKKEYIQKAEPKRKNILKGELAEKYFISVELVEKIVSVKA